MFYQPTNVDIAWAVNTLLYIREGGILAFPAAELIYKVSHKNKTITLINPEVLEDKDSTQTHDRAKTVFGTIGYTVQMSH